MSENYLPRGLGLLRYVLSLRMKALRLTTLCTAAKPAGLKTMDRRCFGNTAVCVHIEKEQQHDVCLSYNNIHYLVIHMIWENIFILNDDLWELKC